MNPFADGLQSFSRRSTCPLRHLCGELKSKTDKTSQQKKNLLLIINKARVNYVLTFITAASFIESTCRTLMGQKEESWAIKDKKLNGVTNGSNKYKSDQWQLILQQQKNMIIEIIITYNILYVCFHHYLIWLTWSKGKVEIPYCTYGCLSGALKWTTSP